MSVAGVDGFYADALGNVFRASGVSAKAEGETPKNSLEDECQEGFSRLPELHVGYVMLAGPVSVRWQQW